MLASTWATTAWAQDKIGASEGLGFVAILLIAFAFVPTLVAGFAPGRPFLGLLVIADSIGDPAVERVTLVKPVRVGSRHF